MIEALFSNNNYVATKRMLDAAAMRHEALAANLANIDTPGYKRVDLPADFSAQFAAKLRAGRANEATVPTIQEDSGALAKGKDGNNVDLDRELLALGSNAMEYETLTEFASGSLKQLRLAITGRVV